MKYRFVIINFLGQSRFAIAVQQCGVMTALAKGAKNSRGHSPFTSKLSVDGCLNASITFTLTLRTTGSGAVCYLSWTYADHDISKLNQYTNIYLLSYKSTNLLTILLTPTPAI